jgi:4-amino-4-deoxy-L-arabinose transferase-like glycosyltransferase
MNKPGSLRKYLLYLIPFIIALLNILLVFHLDKYPYYPSDLTDQGLFQRIAANILHHGKFSGSISPPYEFCAVRPPLYPLLLALIWKVTGGESLVCIRVVQSVAYLLTIFIIFRIGTMLASGNRRYGFISALTASLIPDLAAAANCILAENLAVFFLSLSVFLTVLLRSERKISYLVLLGVSAGLLSLLRPNFLLMIFPLAGYVIFYTERKLKSVLTAAILMVLPFSLTLVPWMSVNKREKGSFVPTYTSVGFGLMNGIIEQSPSLMEQVHIEYRKNINISKTPYYAEMKIFLRSEYNRAPDLNNVRPETLALIATAGADYLDAWKLIPNSADKVLLSDEFFKKTALLWIKKNPVEFLKIMIANVKNLVWNFNLFAYQYQRTDEPAYYAVYVIRILLYIFFLAGTVVTVFERRFNLAFFPLLITLYLVCTHAPMHTEPRYFIYALPFMALLAPAGMNRGLLKPKD